MDDIEDSDLVYGLIGYFEVEGAGQLATEITDEQTRLKNAHTRRRTIVDGDVVIRGIPEQSGLFDRLIEIGVRRGRNYYVHPKILKKWGGLHPESGWLNRAANLPRFCKPESFQEWLKSERKSRQVKFVKPGYRSDCSSNIG